MFLEKIYLSNFKNYEEANFTFSSQVNCIVGENGSGKTTIYPYTFEDALVIENKEDFKIIASSTGLLKKMVEASKKEDIEELAKEAYIIINDKQAKEAEFALDVLYFEDPKKIKTPTYIKEGLDWIEEQLKGSKKGLIINTNG